MSRVNPYNSIRDRQLTAAVAHLLATEYGFLGGRRVLDMLTGDINDLVDQFYPPRKRLEHGTIVWNCTANEGKKAEPGKKTVEYKTISVILPIITREDMDERVKTTRSAAEGRKKGRDQIKKRMARVVTAAADQGGLLTIADLSMIFNVGYGQTGKLLREWEAEQGKLLPMKGMLMDQGSRPTHKGVIIAHFEEGMFPPDIARETKHSLKSVERYLKDYERVLLLLREKMSVEKISSMVGRGKKVVLEYVEQAKTYHPELFSDEENEIIS